MRHAIQTNISHGVKTEATASGDRHSMAPAHEHDLSPRGTAGKSSPSALELHIEELVLTGFSSADRFHIADSVERELARLLVESGIPGLEESSVALEGLDAGKFKVAPGARAHVIGRQAAQAVHRQLSSQRGNATEAKVSSSKSSNKK
jgi:hypothetical protein